MDWTISKIDPSRRLLFIGWLLVLVAAVLVPAAGGVENLPTGIVLGVVAIAMGAWVWLRGSRAALITSLLLGVLLALAFGAFVYTSATSDEAVDALVVVGDVVALIGAVCVVAGAITGLREGRVGPVDRSLREGTMDVHQRIAEDRRKYPYEGGG